MGFCNDVRRVWEKEGVEVGCEGEGGCARKESKDKENVGDM